MKKFTKLFQLMMVFMLSSVIVFGQSASTQEKLAQMDLLKKVSYKSPGPSDVIVCQTGAIFSQPSTNFTNAYTSANSSGGFNYTVYSPFGGVTQPIGGELRWWGLSLTWSGGWAPCTTDPMSFNIKFYQDNAGQPGAEVASFPGVPVNHLDIGELFAGWPLWQWSYTMPSSVNLASGWISIQSESPDNCNFLWCDAPDYPTYPGLQWDGSTFAAIGPLGFCFSSGVQYTLDAGVSSILSPVSGMGLGNEVVTIRVNNFGTSPTTATIPVYYTLNGGAQVNGTVTGPIAPGAYVDYTFAGTVDLSAYGTYNFHACANMTGDLNPANNCTDKAVTNSAPAYCTPVYTSGCTYGDGFTHFEVGAIVNPSGCENTLGPGWSQWFGLGPAEFIPGNTYDFKFMVGYSNTFVNVWIDWDGSYTFDADEMIINGYECVATGTMYTVPTLIPGDAIPGLHQMRARTNWLGPAPDPCASYTYGECEEYMAQIGAGIYGTVNGHVYAYGGSNPIVGANVQLGTQNTTTDANGYYEFPQVSVNTYTGIASKTGYFAQTITGIVVTEGNTTVVDFHLQWSEIAVSPGSVTVTIPPDTQYDTYVTITNNGPHALGYSANLQYLTDQIGFDLKNYGKVIDNPAYGDPYADASPKTTTNIIVPDATGDILVDLDVQATNADNQCLGGETDGMYYYVSGGGAAADPNKLYKHDLTGALISTTNQPAAASGWGIRDLAYDGTFIYGGCEYGFFRFDPATSTFTTMFTSIGTLGCIRACAYNPTDGMFYTGNFGGTFGKFTPAGVITYITNPGLTAVYGMAYDDMNDEMYIFDQTGTPATTMYGWDYHTNTLTGTNFQIPLLAGLTDQIAGGAFFSKDVMPGFAILGGVVQGTNNDKLFGMEFAVTESWVVISSNGSGSVPGYADGSLNLGLHFDATGYPEGTIKTANLNITSDALTNPNQTVPVTMIVMSGSDLVVKAFLQGPYNTTTNLMKTVLNTGGYLPLVQPYGPTLPYYGNNNPFWYYTGAEAVAAFGATVVDWVFVEVRDAANGAAATGATVEQEMVGLLMSDGSIKDLDGTSNLKVTADIDFGCFVVVYHRNHLAMMNATAIPEVGGAYTWDFTTGSGQVYGGALGCKQLEPGVWGAFAADGNGDKQVNTNDKINVWNIDASQSGYKGGDFNLDGQCNSQDKVDIYKPNAGQASQVPN